MSGDDVAALSAAIADLMPRLMRRLFELDASDPASRLPVAQLRVCGILSDGPHTLSELSSSLGVSMSATTQLANRLQRAGLVERVALTPDRRVKHLRLTPHGESVMRARQERRKACVARVVERLAPTARQGVLAGLETLLAATEAEPAAIPRESHRDSSRPVA